MTAVLLLAITSGCEIIVVAPIVSTPSPNSVYWTRLPYAFNPLHLNGPSLSDFQIPGDIKPVGIRSTPDGLEVTCASTRNLF
jgi:hypothetical protein